MRDLSLKFKNVDESMYSHGGLVKIKPFYTWEEKYTIFKNMIEQKDAILMDMVLIVMTAEFCTNIDFDGVETDAEKYDIIAELRLIEDFKLEIDEYMDMYKLVEREKSTYRAFEMLLDGINKIIDGANIEEKLNGVGELVKGNK